jgi:hypothetical protein
MVSYVFDKMIAQGARENQIPARTQASRKWFRETAAGTSITPQALLKGGSASLTSKTLPGRMYTFFYDPKHKKTLPYYDRFPLIFEIKKVPEGFIGMNLHYLPLPLRAKLMDSLYDLTNNTKYDESTRLRLSYDILNNAAKFKWFTPTIKQYLYSHVKSRFLLIDSVEWDMALFLPTERFVKKNKTQVWRESRQIIRGQ